MTSTNIFYRDKPLFGMDIGFSTIKVMQINMGGKQPSVSGYGTTTFDPSLINNGEIVDHSKLAEVAYNLFKSGIVGKINTKRVALAIPASRTFNRSISLPKLANKDIDQAVRLEAEQYIPLPLEELYIDYDTPIISEDKTELLAVAAPKKTIDSFLTLCDILGLEVATVETTIAAASRLFVQAEASDVPTVLIDFGSASADITIYDGGLIVTGTVACGGDLFTKTIASQLGVKLSQAHLIKTKYGLGVSKKQTQIIAALEPVLQQLAREIRRMVRYYEERGGKHTSIGQVVTMGGGANMPGLSDYLTNMLRLPVRMCNPWQRLDFKNLQPPNVIEKSMYVTAAGLGLINPKEILK